MKSNIVNARELFLLCALRKDNVIAINQNSYDWTFRHCVFALNKAMAGPKNKPYGQAITDYEKDARSQIPSQEPKQRNFCIKEGDLGYTLCDLGEDLSWYGTGISNNKGSLSDWFYEGNFILSKPMSYKEQFFVKEYGSYV